MTPSLLCVLSACSARRIAAFSSLATCRGGWRGRRTALFTPIFFIPDNQDPIFADDGYNLHVIFIYVCYTPVCTPQPAPVACVQEPGGLRRGRRWGPRKPAGPGFSPAPEQRNRTGHFHNCTAYSVQRTVYSVQCTEYSVSLVYTVQCTVYTVWFTVYIVLCTAYTVIYTRCILQENLCGTFWQQESPAARSLGLLMSRPAKSPGRSCPTPSNRVGQILSELFRVLL